MPPLLSTSGSPLTESLTESLTDRRVASRPHPIGHLLAAGLVLLAAGCGTGVERRADKAPPLQDVPVAQITRRGALRFVRDYELAQQLAAERQLPRLIYVTAPWCGYCREMEAEAFYDPEVVALCDRFICTLVDGEQQPAIRRLLQVSGYPALVLQTPQGETLLRLAGRQSAVDLRRALHTALQRLTWANQDVLRR